MNRAIIRARHTTRLTLLLLTFFLASRRAPADFIQQTLPLYSETFGVPVGTVVAEANSNAIGSVNGVLPGEVRLTYTVNPVTTYGSIGPTFGFNLVQFAFQPTGAASSITTTLSPGWSLISTNGPFFTVRPTTATDSATTVAVVFDGLGTQASLSDVLQLFSTGNTFPPSPPALALDGLITGFATRGPSGVIITDSFHAVAAPEPSSVLIAVAGFCICAFLGCRTRASGFMAKLLANRPQMPGT